MRRRLVKTNSWNRDAERVGGVRSSTCHTLRRYGIGRRKVQTHRADVTDLRASIYPKTHPDVLAQGR